MKLLAIAADIALDLAAPDEAAVAFLLRVDPTRLVTASAAHQTASIDGLRRLVAHPLSSSQYSQTKPPKKEASLIRYRFSSKKIMERVYQTLLMKPLMDKL